MQSHWKPRPSTVPLIARDLARTCERGWRLACELGLNGEEQAWVLRNATDSLPASDLFVVSADMTTLAVDAALDLPDFHPAAAMPCASGVMVYGRQLPALHPPSTWADHPDSFRRARPAIVTWSVQDAFLEILAWARMEDVEWSTPVEYPAFQRSFDTVLIAAVPLWEQLNFDDTGWGEGVGVLAVLASTWAHMASPGIAAVTERSSTKKAKGRKAADRARPVKVIDLCPVSHGTSVGDGARTYTHRWWVEPYWRSQPYGPGGALRKPVRVPGHIKGPDGAPLLPRRDRVYQWRRPPAPHT